MTADAGGISCCFDKESQRMLADHQEDGLSDTAQAIVDALASSALTGSTVLEVGCGIGALIQELVRRGASSGTGVDLSSKMVQLATSQAARAGLSNSLNFKLGDGAEMNLPESDIVILDSVLCCYPDVPSLVENSSSAARRYYAFAVPDDERPTTKVLRFLLPLQSLFYRRDRFRFYIHSTSRIKEMLGAKGFRMVSKSSPGWIWSVFVYSRAGAG